MNKNEKKIGRNFFLHCDACHHEVDFEGKMTREHIGFQCPVCDSDMLTEADYKTGKRIQAMVSFLTFIRVLKPANRTTVPGSDENLVRIHHHNGRTSVKEL